MSTFSWLAASSAFPAPPLPLIVMVIGGFGTMSGGGTMMTLRPAATSFFPSQSSPFLSSFAMDHPPSNGADPPSPDSPGAAAFLAVREARPCGAVRPRARASPLTAASAPLSAAPSRTLRSPAAPPSPPAGLATGPSAAHDAAVAAAATSASAAAREPCRGAARIRLFIAKSGSSGPTMEEADSLAKVRGPLGSPGRARP